jgi:hypothetical protein
MKMFGNLTTDGLEAVGDRLGGYSVLETGVYPAKVKLAYAGKSASSNAQSITVLFDMNGREHRETFWITNKNGENFSTDAKDPTKRTPLPGFTTVDDLCLLTTGVSLTEQTVEEKVVALYDYELKRDVPQNVPVILDLLNKPVLVGLVRQTVDKTKKNDDGDYVPTGETRDENVTDKLFHHETKRTVAEYRQNVQEPVFHDKWSDKNKGVTRNRSKGAGTNGGVAGRPGMPPTQGQNQPKKSLFA